MHINISSGIISSAIICSKALIFLGVNLEFCKIKEPELISSNGLFNSIPRPPHTHKASFRIKLEHVIEALVSDLPICCFIREGEGK